MDVFLGLVLLLVLLIVSHYLLRAWTCRSCNNLPPGPLGWPIVGSSFSLTPRAFKAFMKMKLDGHPHIMRLYFGEQPMIFLNSYDTIKEALLTKGENFSGRQKMIMMEKMNMTQGIASSEGEFWKEHRRFALRTLRDFGFGRNKSEKIVQDEVNNLVQFIDKEIAKGKCEINEMELLLRSVSNVICTLTMDEQPGYEDHEFMHVIDKLREQISRPMYSSPVIMFPSLFRYFGFVVHLIPVTRRILEALKFTLDFLQIKITAHEEQFDSSQEPRDYIDTFLQEKHKLDATKGPTNHTYTSGELRHEMFELFIAGTDTTSNSLSWGLLLLSIYPEIQEKCHAEIDASIGRERMVTMRDKESLPYLQAVMDEVQRFASIVPMGVFHRNFVADTIHGYHIPASSVIVPFVYGVHHDPRVWERPEEFYPEHFLKTDKESGTLQYNSRVELVPFLIGKRECLGESLAKTELLIFFVSLLQKYQVSLPATETRSVDELLIGTDGTVRSPVSHKLIFQQRS